MSPRQLYFDPWSDDRTTTPYDSRHLLSLQQAHNARFSRASDSVELNDFGLPDIIEEYELTPQHARRAPRVATQPARYGAPSAWSSGVHSPQPQRPMAPANSHGAHLRVVTPQAYGTRPAQQIARQTNVAPPTYGTRPAQQIARQTNVARNARGASRPSSAVQPLRAVTPAPAYRYDEDENPFASRGMTLGGWVLAIGAAAGIFGAVLFGRVLIEAGTPRAAPPSTPLTAAEAMAGSAVVHPEPDSPRGAMPADGQSQPTRSTSSLAGSAPSAPPTANAGASVVAPLTASAIATPPVVTAKERARERRAKHSRRRSSSRESSTDGSSSSVERAEPSSRSVKTRSSAPSSREERASKSESRASATPEPEERETDSKASNGTPGLLRINSRPWSQVFIDGKLVGNTPQLGLQLAPGKHSVRLVNAEFGMTKSFTIKLGAGESVTRVEMLSE